MKFVEPTRLADPDAAARKLVEIANAVEAVQGDSQITSPRGGSAKVQVQQARIFSPTLGCARAFRRTFSARHGEAVVPIFIGRGAPAIG